MRPQGASERMYFLSCEPLDHQGPGRLPMSHDSKIHILTTRKKRRHFLVPKILTSKPSFAMRFKHPGWLPGRSKGSLYVQINEVTNCHTLAKAIQNSESLAKNSAAPPHFHVLPEGIVPLHKCMQLDPQKI